MSADATSAWISEVSGGVIVRILVQPKASRTEVMGPHGEPARLKIRVAAPPVDGAANEELLRFLKKQLKLPISQLVIVRGDSSKMKDVLCSGASLNQVLQALSSGR
ncbi:MAG: YggU family protein [Bdellovibrionales bacterium GWB1_55_8]|nr:MAG: YggU family protein [Bdellovibrionales bacterium GWB1_55_8]